jgi:hypothetical protein
MKSSRVLTRLLLAAVAGALAVGGSPAVAHADEGAPPIRDDARRVARRVASYRDLQRRNVVMQQRDYSCGAAALATLAKYYLGDNVDESHFLRLLDEILTPAEIKDRIENGLALSDLRRAAVKSGYEAAVAKMSLEKLFEAKAPLLVGIDVDDFKHFVVYRGFDGYWVYLADPIRGNLRIPAADFREQWQKNLALAIAKKGVKPNEHSALALTDADLFLGRTNRQLILSQPGRGSIHEPAATRH